MLPSSHRPWTRQYDEGVPPSLAPYPRRTLLDFLREGVAERPGAAALIFKGAVVTKERLDRLSDAFAAGLAALGVGRGDRVALLLPNCPQFLVAELGAWKVGAVVAPLNPVYSDRELEEVLGRCRPAATVVLNRFYDRLAGLPHSAPLGTVIPTGIKEHLPPHLRVLFSVARERSEGERITLRPGHIPMAELLRRHRGAPPAQAVIGPDDPAVLLMSGGTTGSPKAVPAPHGALVASGLQLRSWLSPVLRPWSDAVLLPLPLFHVYGNVGAQSLALVGHNPLVLVPNPRDIGDLVATIRRSRPAFIAGVPALFSAMLAHKDVRAGKVDLTSIRACFSGASPLLAETRRRFEEATGGAIVEGYSLTEALMACCANPVRGRSKQGSVGVPLPDVDVRIVDEDDPGAALPPGEVGEIVLHAPQVMPGYWGSPEETEEVLATGVDGRRWLRTGDLGYMDPDGYVFIVDRKKDLIKVGGMQVWPREVEEVLATHPDVVDVGVAGVPHERKGEVPKAWVVVRPGAEPQASELRAYCRHHMAPYKVPAAVEFCTELPRNMAGKVLRRELRARDREAREGAGVGG